MSSSSSSLHFILETLLKLRCYKNKKITEEVDRELKREEGITFPRKEEAKKKISKKWREYYRSRGREKREEAGGGNWYLTLQSSSREDSVKEKKKKRVKEVARRTEFDVKNDREKIVVDSFPLSCSVFRFVSSLGLHFTLSFYLLLQLQLLSRLSLLLKWVVVSYHLIILLMLVTSQDISRGDLLSLFYTERSLSSSVKNQPLSPFIWRLMSLDRSKDDKGKVREKEKTKEKMRAKNEGREKRRKAKGSHCPSHLFFLFLPSLLFVTFLFLFLRV